MPLSSSKATWNLHGLCCCHGQSARTHLHTPREGNHLEEMLTKANLSSPSTGTDALSGCECPVWRCCSLCQRVPHCAAAVLSTKGIHHQDRYVKEFEDSCSCEP